MKEYKKVQRQWQEMTEQQSRLETRRENRANVMKGENYNEIGRKMKQKDRLMQKKKDMQQRFEQKKYKYNKNDRLKEQFR